MPDNKIYFEDKNDWKKTFGFLKALPNIFSLDGLLKKYGEMGVNALKSATPVDTSMTANSWYYDIEQTEGLIKLNFNNANVVDGANVAILIQYGHATKNGGYVTGIDYINPAIRPIFDSMVDELYREVQNL